MSREADKLKIAQGAVQILQHPNTFCQGIWFIGKQIYKDDGHTLVNPDLEAKNIDPSHPDGYEQLRDHFEQNKSSLANPNFQVCGQGAIYTSAILQGYEYEIAQELLQEVEQETGGIITFNDEEGTRDSVRGLIEDGFTHAVKGYIKKGEQRG